MAKKIPTVISEYMAAIGCKGGKAGAATMTVEQRRARARKAARARWKGAMKRAK